MQGRGQGHLINHPVMDNKQSGIEITEPKPKPILMSDE